MDTLITTTPQSGFYPVFIFKADMSGVYLSLNQGVTEVKENYKREAQKVLRTRAEDYRAKINFDEENLTTIDLASSSSNAKLYVAGNIVAKYYPAKNLPTSAGITKDILKYINLYEELIFNDNRIIEENWVGASVTEKKQYRFHTRIERNSVIPQKVKERKGYTCEACNFNFSDNYGNLGKNFIEAHHLTPISKLGIGKFKLNIDEDFAVLCSNCHSMIHKLDDPSNLNLLRQIILEANKTSK